MAGLYVTVAVRNVSAAGEEADHVVDNLNNL